jgi:gliding motility-associated-like protein
LPQFGNVILDGTYTLECNIELLGNLLFQNGIMDVGANELRLHGDFINESEDTYAHSSSDGEIVKEINLTAGERKDWGSLGLAITPAKSINSLTLRRGNEIQNNGEHPGIKRYYSFSEAVDLQEVEFNYWKHELNSIPQEDLSIWSKSGNAWTENTKKREWDGGLQADGYESTEKLSLFPAKENQELKFMQAFSPNSDGYNDTYIIQGIEAYPKNSFMVINQWADVVYEAAPYKNDWKGKTSKGVLVNKDHTLMDGTYFYVFYPDKGRSEGVVRGFFEIKTK